MLVRLYRFCVLCLCLGCAQVSFAQEQDAHAVRQRLLLNKVEFLFNSQQADSIYALTSEDYQAQIALPAFKSFLENELFILGRIEAISLINYKDRIGQYKLSFKQHDLQLSFQVDSADKINLFLIRPYVAPTSTSTLPVLTSKKLTLTDVVDSLKNWYIKQNGSRALAIGVVEGGKTSQFYIGQRDAVQKSIPNEQSLFELASLTKTFTAGLLAYYADSLSLPLDQPLISYLPDSVAQNAALKEITLLQLANHTSGLPRLPKNLAAVEGFEPDNPYARYGVDHLLDALAKYQPDSTNTPGTYAYSNFGYGVLGYVLTQMTGKSLDEMMQEVIFQPLSMTRTLLHVPTQDEEVLQPHTIEGNPTPRWHFEAMAATGGYSGTLPDMLSYIKAHLQSPVTNTEIALANTRQFTHFIPPGTDVGLAWSSEIRGGKLVYMHSGMTYGSNSLLLLCPDDKTGVVLLSNAALPIQDLGWSLMDFLLQP
jgi:CubicO group peptidase (beta-lactamase class C family)